MSMSIMPSKITSMMGARNRNQHRRVIASVSIARRIRMIRKETLVRRGRSDVGGFLKVRDGVRARSLVLACNPPMDAFDATIMKDDDGLPLGGASVRPR